MNASAHNMSLWDDESVLLMADHMEAAFEERGKNFALVKRLPEAERIVACRRLLWGTLEDLLPSQHFGPPVETALPLPSEERHIETLEQREDRALAKTLAQLGRFTDEQWEAGAARHGMGTETYRKETWAKVFRSNRNFT